MTTIKPGQVSMQVVTDASVRRKLRILAARQERTMQEVAADALRKYLSDHGEPVDDR